MSELEDVLGAQINSDKTVITCTPASVHNRVQFMLGGRFVIKGVAKLKNLGVGFSLSHANVRVAASRVRTAAFRSSRVARLRRGGGAPIRIRNLL
eukprot:10382137-Alexandrium_andersonii.AAC.1